MRKNYPKAIENIIENLKYYSIEDLQRLNVAIDAEIQEYQLNEMIWSL